MYILLVPHVQLLRAEAPRTLIAGEDHVLRGDGSCGLYVDLNGVRLTFQVFHAVVLAWFRGVTVTCGEGNDENVVGIHGTFQVFPVVCRARDVPPASVDVW